MVAKERIAMKFFILFNKVLDRYVLELLRETFIVDAFATMIGSQVQVSSGVRTIERRVTPVRWRDFLFSIIHTYSKTGAGANDRPCRRYLYTKKKFSIQP